MIETMKQIQVGDVVEIRSHNEWLWYRGYVQNILGDKAVVKLPFGHFSEMVEVEIEELKLIVKSESNTKKALGIPQNKEVPRIGDFVKLVKHGNYGFDEYIGTEGVITFIDENGVATVQLQTGTEYHWELGRLEVIIRG